jgi:hypothetical protein
MRASPTSRVFPGRVIPFPIVKNISVPHGASPELYLAASVDLSLTELEVRAMLRLCAQDLASLTPATTTTTSTALCHGRRS